MSLKTTTLYGLLAKLESAYLGGGSLSTSTDGILCAEPPGVPAKAYLFDGGRGRAEGTGGLRKGAPPTGGTRSGTVKGHLRGYGAAYSAANLPPDLHRFMLASGHSHAVVTTGGSETVTYTPRTGPASFDSLVLQMYAAGDLYKMKGVVGNLKIAADGVGLPTWDFDWDGVDDLSAYAEQLSVPSITYSDTPIPPAAVGMTIGIGDFVTPVVRGFSFDAGRVRSPRANLAIAGGHNGWTLAERAPTLELRLEKAALVNSPYHTSSGLDLYRLMDAGTAIAVSLRCGATQYNKWVLTCPQVQITGVSEEDDGGSAVYAITGRVHCSAPGTNDDYTLKFD